MLSRCTVGSGGIGGRRRMEYSNEQCDTVEALGSTFRFDDNNGLRPLDHLICYILRLGLAMRTSGQVIVEGVISYI